MKKAALLLLGGGAAALGVALFAKRKSDATTDAIKDAIAAPAAPPRPGQPAGAGATVKVHTTGYWPFVAGLTAAEKKMEGGTTDRKGQPLHTLESHLRDPVSHPFVSVAGDFEIWPYGQRVAISAWPGVVFRVVDTGGHFHGANKVYRVAGEEPIDICVESAKTPVPKKNVTATIYPGDNFKRGKAVAVGKFKDQTVSAGEFAWFKQAERLIS